MCGIAGWISTEGIVEPETLVAMRDSLAHRGPDGKANWVSPDATVGLAHRRLAIIDLSTLADQPMRCHEADTTIVFNGEIYNHRELRKELEQEGVEFTTDHSDTEVLLLGYVNWGLDKLLTRINGMFAVAINDGRSDSLFLVRDRVGIKPLYFCRKDHEFLFASEIKALFQHPKVAARLDREHMQRFLSFRSLPAPACLFAGISKVAPGSYVRISTLDLSQQIVDYWDPLCVEIDTTTSQNDAEERLAELLDDSVRLRMEADTDVGVLLSGGLDSSYILEVASRFPGQLSSFTASYPEHPQYDEGQDATRIANQYGSRHFDVAIDDNRYLSVLGKVAFHQDEPIAAPVCVPVYLLAEAAHSANVPVLLAGEGSDELFIGYDNWLRIRSAQSLLNRLPGGVSKFAGALGSQVFRWLPSSDRLADFTDRVYHGRPLFWGGAMDFSESAKNRLINGGRCTSTDTFEHTIAPFWRNYCQARDPNDVTGWMTYVDLKFRLPELMLPRLDKMGMAFSIEGRVPFLDHRLIEFTMSLPPELRAATGSVGKPLFKSIAGRKFEKSFVYQPKRGFQAPVKEWKSGTAGAQYINALIAFSERTDIFNPLAVKALLNTRRDRLYFSLLNFAMWYSIFIENVIEEFVDTREFGKRAA